MTTILVKLLLCEYIFILIVSLIEKDWKWALYWAGAAMLTSGLLCLGYDCNGWGKLIA